MENYLEQAKYFKNTELIKMYGVSDKAIRNWIEKSRQGKIDLELLNMDGKTYIKDSFKNNAIVEQLVWSGKKYRNKRVHRIISPTEAFYSLYTKEQVIDIINSLEKYRETPVHYRYLGKGANYWDAYLHKLSNLDNSYVTSTVELLKLDQPYIASLIERHKYVNIIDVGVGNGLSVKDFLGFVQRTGKLKKYIGIDISKSLLDKAERNIHTWFGDSIEIEKHVRDVNFERFADVISKDSYTQDAALTLNLVLSLGGTLTNFREPAQLVKTIQDSMGKDDLLITTLKLDSEKARSFFDYDIPKDRTLLSFHDRYTLDLLSIDRSFYDVEQLFEEQTRCRYIRIRLKVSVTINFKVGDYVKQVELDKGEPILLIRMWHFKEREIVEILNKSGFALLKSSKTYNEEYALLIARPNTNPIST